MGNPYLDMSGSAINDGETANRGKTLGSSFGFNGISELLRFLDLEGGSDQKFIIEALDLGELNEGSSGSDEDSEGSKSGFELDEVGSGGGINGDHGGDQFVSESGVGGLDLVESFGEDGFVDLAFLVVEETLVLFVGGSLEEGDTEGEDISLGLVISGLKVLLGNQSQDFGGEDGAFASNSSNQSVVVLDQSGVNELVTGGGGKDVFGVDVVVVDLVSLEVSQTEDEVFSNEEDFSVRNGLVFLLGGLDGILEGLFEVFNEDVDSESGGAEAGFLLAVVAVALDEGFVGVGDSFLAELQFLFVGRFGVDGDFLLEHLELGVFFSNQRDLAVSGVFESLFDFVDGFVGGDLDALEQGGVFLTLDDFLDVLGDFLGLFLNFSLGNFLMFLDLLVDLFLSVFLDFFTFLVELGGAGRLRLRGLRTHFVWLVL
jgi:hypothetical protein